MTTRSTQLLVIGAGVTGLGVAWDACLRGMAVTVVEQGDLGQGTSGRYHGLLHSGARYVLSDPTSAVDCRRENALLRRLVPHAIEPTGGLCIATSSDPQEYVGDWLEACRRLELPVDEVTAEAALRREPLLTSQIARAFEVRDAALDSFELLHALARGVVQAGGTVMLRHRVSGLVPHGGGLLARIVSLADGTALQLEAPVVVNAAGPFSGAVAAMAGVTLPLALGKGTMVAMASRLTQTVLSRCKAPHDGDIIVPVGTVCILGTTDVPVRSPTELTTEPWEVDLLLREGQVLIPTLRRHRALRTWAGIRALYRPPNDRAPTRALPRAHALIDHQITDGVPGLLSILGGKLTTYRKMAEDTVDLVAAQARVDRPCRTAAEALPVADRRHYSLGERAERVRASGGESVSCECELVLERQVRDALEAGSVRELDDLRRDLRLGMGPCQAAFCAYRAASLALARLPDSPPDGGLADFAQERWRGMRNLAWGRGLRQAELLRRIQVELLGAESDAADR